MSAKPLLLWGLAGFLGVAALSMLIQREPDVITLERGLGPEIRITQL